MALLADTGQGRLQQANHAIAAALAEANDVPLFTQNQQELAAAVCELPALQAQLDAYKTAVTAQAQRVGVPQAAGLRTIGQYVAAETNTDPKAARADAWLGRWLGDFDGFAAAFAAGKMTRSHLRIIQTRLDNPRTHRALIADQQVLIDAAANCSFDGFETVVAYWAIAADPDGEEPREQLAKCGLGLRKRYDGCVAIDGLMDPIMGHAALTAVEFEYQKLFRDDTANGVTRTSRQRRAHAMINLIQRGAARADGTLPIPLVNVVMSEKVAEDTLERINKPSSEPLPVDADDIDGRCELIDGTPIHPHYALAVLGVANLRRHVMSANSRTLDVSVDTRAFTPAQKNTLLVEARGKCTTIGCDAPFAWLEADHHHPHNKHGPTIIANGKMRCAPDNRYKSDHPPDPDHPNRLRKPDKRAA